jgi:predicted unusual protein kinase regulating ubiquinone biosynthesis (AarF/ABC1/UbiB family)
LRVLGRLLRYALAQLSLGSFASDAQGPARLVRLFEDLGGIYLKLGQLLSLQVDVLPRAYCNALFDLLDRVPPMSWERVERVIEAELGQPVQHCYDLIDRAPMASGSIAQVHVAELGGRRLAVKVQRPDAARRFLADLEDVERGRRWIRRLRMRSLEWLSDALGELARWTREELDFRQEARYQRAVAYLVRDSTREVVPEVVVELSGRTVLTSELLVGPTMLQVVRALEARDAVGRTDRGTVRGTDDGPSDATVPAELERLGFEANTFAAVLASNFVGGAFERGVFHADLHPANLIVLDGNRVGYVDFGITSALSRHARRHTLALILAFVDGDLDALAFHLEAIADPKPEADAQRLRRELELAARGWYLDASGDEAATPRLAKRFTPIMLDVLRASRRSGLMATPDTARYLRSVIALEGLIVRFAPDFDIEACLRRIAREQLESEAVREWLDGDRLADWIYQGAELARRLPVLVADAFGRGRERAGAKSSAAARTPPRGARGVLVWGLLALALGLLLASLEEPSWSRAATVLPSLGLALVIVALTRRLVG